MFVTQKTAAAPRHALLARPLTFTCFSLDGKAIDGCFGCRSSRWLRRRDTNGGNGGQGGSGGPSPADAAPCWLAECIFDAAVILVAVVGILAAIVVAVVAATYVSVLTVC